MMIKNLYVFAVLACLNMFTTGISSAAEDTPASAAPDATTPAQAPTSYKAPYPFTLEELLDKIFQVADQHGYITREQVESIFGVKMNKDEDFYNQYHETIYTLIGGKDWYFNLTVGDNKPTRSLFYFTWGSAGGQNGVTAIPAPAGMCITPEKFKPAIEKHGWALRRQNRELQNLPFSDGYRSRRYGILVVEFYPDDNCLRSIRISTSKTAIREYPPF